MSYERAIQALWLIWFTLEEVDFRWPKHRHRKPNLAPKKMWTFYCDHQNIFHGPKRAQWSSCKVKDILAVWTFSTCSVSSRSNKKEKSMCEWYKPVVSHYGTHLVIWKLPESLQDMGPCRLRHVHTFNSRPQTEINKPLRPLHVDKFFQFFWQLIRWLAVHSSDRNDVW